MIALYKFTKPMEQLLDNILQKSGFKTTRFYSVNSLLDQIMNPMVILTPDVFKNDLEFLPVLFIPISIHLMDIERTIEEHNLEYSTEEPILVVASKEELKWVEMEYLDNQRIPIRFVCKEQFFSSNFQSNRVYLAPIWENDLATLLPSLYYIKPTITSLNPVLQLVNTMERIATEISRERYQGEAIVNSAHDGVIAVDREGCITVVNEHAKKILGLKGEVKGRKITEFIPESDMMRVLTTGKIEMGDIANITNRQIVINRFPVIVRGRVVGAVSNFKELTDIQRLELKLRKRLHQNGLEAKYSLSDIVGQSREINEAKELASQFAKTEATVLITGESGTGKELFAQGIHRASNRALGPFVAVNCAALPENLMESELFGYEEGAFTGARKGGKAGLFEIAHGGTLFLDEIGEMPLPIQTALLRVLQERTVRRVGGERFIPVDVRIVTATHRSLEEEVENKLFRSDLYYRLNVLALEIPPLRDRLADIPALVESIVNQFNHLRENKISNIKQELYSLFKEYDWPGNIRELRNVIERMVVLERGSTLRIEGAAFLSQNISRRMGDQQISKPRIKDKEKELIISTLNKYENNKTLAAKSLGIDRTTLWRKMKDYHI